MQTGTNSGRNDVKKKVQTVTAADVARLAGVSKWTVIRAFKPDARILDSTRQKVLEVASSLNYQPNLLAASLVTKKTHQVAILVDDFDNPFKLPVLKRLTSALQREGLLGILVNVDAEFDQAAALSDARQRRIDAIIFFGTDHDPTMLAEKMRGSNQPVIVLARESVGDALPAIYTDAGHAVSLLGPHLWERGYRKPIFVGGPDPMATALGRRRMFRSFWQMRGITEMPEIKIGVYDYTTAVARLQEPLAALKQGEADVLICENDILALAAMDVLRFSLGLRVPEDIAVIGFDGIEQARTPGYSLTTYQQPVDLLVGSIVDMLTERRPYESCGLFGQMIVGSST
jgi:LacI family transcriptional regulator